MSCESECDLVERIADAVLFEGYVLYPYRLSALKNRQRWNFGVLCPRAYAETNVGSEFWRFQTQYLAVADERGSIHIKLRFLHLIDRRIARTEHHAGALDLSTREGSHFVESLETAGHLYQASQEASPREIDCPDIVLGECREPLQFDFRVAGSEHSEPLRDAEGQIVGAILRRQNALDLGARVEVARLGNSLFRLTLEILNLTSIPPSDLQPASGPQRTPLTRDQVMMFSPASTHAIFKIFNGEFLSSIDPPQKYAEAAASCTNTGLYPVLVGVEEEERSTMLASPVILYDYPKIAPESAVDLFDGTEIDEILTLRILAMTDQEKAEMRQGDERTRRILEQIESNPARLAQLHGTMRSTHTDER